MKIIVFGGGGFLGSYVAEMLTEAGHTVKIFGPHASKYLVEGQEMIVGDITDQTAVEAAVKGCDVVYNFSAVADIDVAKSRPVDVVKVNILGNTLALEAARKAGVKRFVYASSVYAYSRFGSFYSNSKVASEKITETYEREYGLPFTVLRYGSLYGPARSVHLSSVNKFIAQAVNEGKISYPGTGDEMREYIHVKDAARASVEILAPEFKNQHVLITGHQMLTSRELLTMINEMLGGGIEIEFKNLGNRAHYQMTGYSFQPILARKYIPSLTIDIGQGLLDLVEEEHRKLHPEAYTGHPLPPPEEEQGT